ncbi:MAG: FHA domain-containing protein [bacterium]
MTVQASDGPAPVDPPLPRLNPPPAASSAPTLLDFRMPEQMLAELARAREAKARPSSAPPPAQTPVPEPTRTPPRPAPTEPSMHGMAVVRPSRQQGAMGAIARALREEAGSGPPAPEGADDAAAGRLPPLPVLDELDEELGSVDLEPAEGFDRDDDLFDRRPTMRLEPPEPPLGAIETMEPEEIPPEDDDAEWVLRPAGLDATDADRPSLETARSLPATLPETQALAAVVLPPRPSTPLPLEALPEEADGADAAPDDGPVDDGPVDDGPVDDGPVDDGPGDDGPGAGGAEDGPGPGANAAATRTLDDVDQEDDLEAGQPGDGADPLSDVAGLADLADLDDFVDDPDLRAGRAGPATIESLPPLELLPEVLLTDALEVDGGAPAIPPLDDEDEDELPFALASDDSSLLSAAQLAEGAEAGDPDDLPEPDAFSGTIDDDEELPSVPPGGDVDDLLEDVEDLIEEVDEDASDLLASDEFEAFNIEASGRAGPPPLPAAGFVLRPLTENLDASLVLAVGPEGIVIGRSEGDLVVDDPYASPRHAFVEVEDDTLYVDDLESTNGVWLRVRDEVLLHPGDRFLAGEHVFRLELCPPEGPSTLEDGLTRRLGATPALSGLRLVVEAGDGTVTHTVRVPQEGCRIGRHLADLVFTHDGFMSGTHALLRPRQDAALLRDLESRNGTWRLLHGRTRLEVGDALMVGRTVLRVGAPAR